MENPFEILQQQLISIENKLENLLNAIESNKVIKVQPEEAANRTQAAKYLNVSVSTIDALVKSKQLKSFRIGKSVRFTYAGLDEFIEKRKKY